MDIKSLPDNPYLLLTPGPLSTTKTVKAAMLRDWCTWDDDYKELVQEVRAKLIRLADGQRRWIHQRPHAGKRDVLRGVGHRHGAPDDGETAGPSQRRLRRPDVQIAQTLKIDCVVNDSGEVDPPDLEKLEATLKADRAITHVAVVHSETTTGMLNPIEADRQDRQEVRQGLSSSTR